MLVFIDESGDPGFKIEQGSSPLFVTSMVIIKDKDVAGDLGSAIVELRKRLRITPEFKFNKCSNPYKEAFFEEVAPFEFSCRFVVVQKQLIHSPALRSVKESFYKFFIRMMMQRDGGMLKDAKVVIDGSGDRLFKKQFRTYLKRQLDPGAVRAVDLKDSVRDPLIQLADMTAGAIARSYRDDRKNPRHFRSMLAANGQINNVWEFK